jgi:hypothetical protein
VVDDTGNRSVFSNNVTTGTVRDSPAGQFKDVPGEDSEDDDEVFLRLNFGELF